MFFKSGEYERDDHTWGQRSENSSDPGVSSLLKKQHESEDQGVYCNSKCHNGPNDIRDAVLRGGLCLIDADETGYQASPCGHEEQRDQNRKHDGHKTFSNLPNNE